ncbi:MAG: tetratricopeptide repeat protein, partial [Kangiellaceae bacterium]|nr:tetratricopeptide repeat protein [Kangiellaceae bacterium]
MTLVRILLSSLLILNSYFVSSQEVPDSFDPEVLNDALTTIKDDSSKFEVYLRLLEAYRLSAPAKAKKYHEKIIFQSENGNFHAIRAKSYSQVTLIAQANAQLDSMLAFSQLATTEAMQSQDTGLYLQCMNNEAIALASHNKGKEAIELLNTAIALSRTILDTNALLQSQLYLANIYSQYGDFTNTIELINADSAIWNRMPSSVKAQFWYVKANALFSLQRNEAALTLYKRAYPVFEQLPNPFNLLQLLNNLSTCYAQLQAYDSALAVNAEAIPLALQLGDKRGLGNAYISRANVYYLQENVDSAIVYAQYAEETLTPLNDPFTYIQVLDL